MGRTERSRFAAIIVGGLALATLAPGCANLDAARYVYQDGDFGVVGIPKNTDHWPTYYHDQAEALMARHFPAGFEIVRAEEVVEGSRTLTVNGTNTAEIGAASALPVLKAITLGRTSTKNQADQVKIKECRILYKRADHTDLPHDGPDLGFTPDSTPSPKLYVDPNAEARNPKPPTKSADPRAVVAKAEGAKAEAAKPDDKPAEPTPES